MPPTAPALLLRLREADIVRLCGLACAARGLDLFTQGAITRPERHGSRLSARVRDPEATTPTAGDEEGCAAWIEADDAAPSAPPASTGTTPSGSASAAPPAALRFGCSCAEAGRTHTSGTPGSDTRACAHVAALLSAWIRRPADFLVPEQETHEHHERPHPPAPPAERSPSQPPTLLPRAKAERPPAPPASLSPARSLMLADEIERLPTADVLDIARRVLGESALAGTTDETGLPDPARVRATLVATLRDPLLVEALVARLDPLSGMLLFTLAVRGGVLTVADVDGVAVRMSRPASALQNALDILERHALVFRVSGRAGTPAGSRTWRDLTGWRVPIDLASLTITELPLPTAPTPQTLPQRERPTGQVELAPGHQPRRQPTMRVRLASPRALLLTLVLLSRAPRPLGPLATPAATEYANQPPRTVATRVQPAPTSRPGGHAFPLVPGDLAPQRLSELARVAGLDPGIARMARRVLLWARAADPDAPLLDLMRLAPANTTAWLDALAEGFRLWARAESATELADLDLCRPSLRLGVNSAHPAFRPAAQTDDVRRARTLVLRLLRLARGGLWYRVDDLLDLLWQAHPTFLRGAERLHTTPPWWLELAASGQRLRTSVPDEWHAAEGALVRALMLGPLSWWGILDLATAEAPSATDTEFPEIAFRVTALGEYLLASLASERPDAAPGPASEATASEGAAALLRSALAGDWGAPFLVTRAHEIAVQPFATGAAALDALDLCAEPRAVAAARLLYAPSPDSACLAFDRGLSPKALLAPLRAAEGSQPTGESRGLRILAERLEEWYAAYGAARITRGMALLEAADEAALAEALAYVPSVAARARRLSPTLALVPTDALDALRDRLAHRGYHL